MTEETKISCPSCGAKISPDGGTLYERSPALAELEKKIEKLEHERDAAKRAPVPSAPVSKTKRAPRPAPVKPAAPASEPAKPAAKEPEKSGGWFSRRRADK